MTPETRFEDYLAVETAGGPTWHPDGKHIAFTSNATGLYQIYACDIEKGKTLPRTQLTDEEDRCTDPRYLSDGTLIFTRDRGGDENFQIGLINVKGSLHWLTSDLGAKHRISRASDSYLYFSANLNDRGRLDVYRWKIPLRDNEPELIYEPERGIIQVAEVSDDESKVLMIQYLGNMDQHLLLLEASSGNVLDLTATIIGNQLVRWEVVRWLDPENILVNTDYKADFKRLAIITTEGGFTPLDDLSEKVQFEIEKYTYSKDSIWTYFVENQEGYSTIHRAKFSKDGATDFETLQFPLRGVIPAVDARSWDVGLRLSSDEHMLAVTVSSGVQPTNVWILSIKEMSNWRASEVSTSGLVPFSFVESTLHRFDSFDDLSVPYFRYIPKGKMPSGGWPALLIIHGGPESQIRPEFNPVTQFFLSSGFAVITPNIRGSAGYGRTYLDLDNVEKRLDSIKDIKHLALHLKSEDAEIDGNRLVICGGSYGGFAVLSAMTEHPELWKAGVDIVGISNFVTFLKNTAAWRRSLREAEYGSLEHDLETLEKVSPIHKIDKISAPLFIIQGDNDERVPLSESIQMYEKLKEKGLPVKMLRFADEGHGLAKLENRIKAYSEVVSWLDEIV
ncbi:MAG: S9 family peptidase [Candidatus Thorarchaeota archaeon]|nr:S9 family peptidase [Candidatus Thorarchaeota archaeon]